MLAGTLIFLQYFHILVEASGSSIAVRTIATSFSGSRSMGRKTRSRCVICPFLIRKATSSLSPSAGHTTVTLASALRRLRTRPAATWTYLSQACWWFINPGPHTSPPPTTRTFFLLICHAKMREPPPCTSGYSPSILSAFAQKNERNLKVRALHGLDDGDSKSQWI